MDRKSEAAQNFNPECLAYTEEKVLVRKIFVYNITGMGKPPLEEYLKTFGEIEEIQYQNKISKIYGKRFHYIYAFVQFKDARAAALVLIKCFHQIGERKHFRVKPCFAWQQPDFGKFNNMITLPDALNNYECLEVILRHSTLETRISLAMISERCAGAFVSFFKKEYGSVNIEGSFLTLIQQHFFFKMMGEHILAITCSIDNLDKLAIDSITAYCSNLKTLKLNVPSIKNQTLRKLLTHLKCIKELSFSTCMDDTLAWVVQRFCQVETLSLRDCDVTGKYINNMHTLKSLELIACKNITLSNFTNICRSLELRELSLDFCNCMREPNFRALADYQQTLEVLKLTGRIYHQQVLRLPNLKSLYITHIVGLDINDEFFNTLSQRTQLQRLVLLTHSPITNDQAALIARLTNLIELQCPYFPNNAGLEHFCNLKDLEILNVFMSRVTKEGLLLLLTSCKKLKSLDIRSCNVGIQFLREAIRILHNRKDPKTSLKVKCCGTHITKHGWNTLVDGPGKELLELDFTNYVVEFE